MTMFDADIFDEDVAPSQNPEKKRKLNPLETDVVHSSLGYETFKAPPLVEYRSIDCYCEKKLGKSLLPSPNDSSSVSHSKVSCISSPIILKSPNRSDGHPTLNKSCRVPYAFFSVEELSLVRSLSHWTNIKVCPVGTVESGKRHTYLHSFKEKESWRILLDISKTAKIPTTTSALQVYGCMTVIAEKPVIKVDFFRDLGSADITLFVKSYRMMQKYIPDYLNLPKKNDFHQPKNPPAENFDCSEMNNTLDEIDFPATEKKNCTSGCSPYFFYSVEELSLVRSLTNWTNKKVCPVGIVKVDISTQDSYLHSHQEEESWKILLEGTDIPKTKTVLQVYGCIKVVDEKPVLKIDYFRDLSSADVLQQFRNSPNNINVNKPKSPPVENTDYCEMNNTLDDYDLSSIEKLV